MYIYNVTINIDESVHGQWMDWIKNHVREILATGYFSNAKMIQVLVEEEMGGLTYSIQYTALSKEDIEKYKRLVEPGLEHKASALFADKMLMFKTELKIIEEFFSQQ